MNGPYDDIINCPHPVSANHPQMPVADRAAQFAPFAAVTGYGEMIREIERSTQRRIRLDENSLEVLERKLRLLSERIGECPQVEVTYFVPDEKKDGGVYKTVTGRLQRLDLRQRTLWLTDGTHVCLDDILELESEMFPDDSL